MIDLENLECRYLLSGLTSSVIAKGLTSPTAMDLLPDGRILIAEQAGTLRIVRNGSLATNPAAMITVDHAGERGLIGVAHDPNFNSNQFFTVMEGNSIINKSAIISQLTNQILMQIYYN